MRLQLTARAWRVVLVCPHLISFSVIINYTNMSANSRGVTTWGGGGGLRGTPEPPINLQLQEGPVFCGNIYFTYSANSLSTITT